MNLVVVSNPESIAAAIELERRTEQAIVEEALAEILASEVTETGPCGPWISRFRYLDEALGRHRETVVPRLQAIAEGSGGESEVVRIDAARTLGKIDPQVGFRALLTLLNGDDPLMLSWTLDELEGLAITAEEDRLDLSAFVPGPAELGRIRAFLDHPDERVVRAAISLLDQLKPAGVYDHDFLPRMDDPVHGKSIRWMLASEGRETSLLDRAYAALDIPGRSVADDHALELFEWFARSDDPRNAPRAVEMMEVLLAGESLLPNEREHLKTRLG